MSNKAELKEVATLIRDVLTIEVGQSGEVVANITVQSGDDINDIVNNINALGWAYLYATAPSGKLVLYSAQTGQNFNDISPAELVISGTGTILADLGIDAGTYNQPALSYGTSAQQPLWQANQSQPRPSGSVWIKVGAAGNGLDLSISRYDSTIASWVAKTVNYSTSDWNMIYALDSTGGKNIPAGTIYAQYNYDYNSADNTGYSLGPVYYWERIATGPTVVVGDNTAPEFNSTTLGAVGPYFLFVRTSVPGSEEFTTAYVVTIPNNSDATDFVTAWSAANIPYTTASVATSGAIVLTHTEGGVIMISDTQADGFSNGVLDEIGLVVGSTSGVKEGRFTNITFTAPTTSSPGTGAEIYVTNSYQTYWVDSGNIATAGSGYSVGDILTVDGADLGGLSGTNDLEVVVTSVDGLGGVTAVS